MYQRFDDNKASLSWWRGMLMVLLPSLLAFVLMDFIWIAFVANQYYKQQLASILRSDPDILAGVLAWLCIVSASYIFVLPRALACDGMGRRAMQGALMGVVLYGTCDLTNCSLVRDWSWPLAVLDMCWGTTACTVLALVQSSLYSWATRGAR